MRAKQEDDSFFSRLAIPAATTCRIPSPSGVLTSSGSLPQLAAGEQNNAISRQFFVHLPLETVVNLLKPGEVITQTIFQGRFLVHLSLCLTQGPVAGRVWLPSSECRRARKVQWRGLITGVPCVHSPCISVDPADNSLFWPGGVKGRATGGSGLRVFRP